MSLTSSVSVGCPRMFFSWRLTGSVSVGYPRMFFSWRLSLFMMLKKNKTLTVWLINSKNVLLTVLETGWLTSGCQLGQARALFKVADFSLRPLMQKALGISLRPLL